jgi:23S rRNA (adenine2503-C2)-methyltransferase
MGLIKKIEVPTGHICIIEGNKGKLEFLSIGDYGKEKNIKADFLGLDKEINGVPNGNIMPLTEKWVITISSQYGCSMNCTFCDVPKVGKGINVNYYDLIKQVLYATSLHPEIKYTKRLNLHYARMGEPTFNNDVFEATYFLSYYFKNRNFKFHPVISTMMPNNNNKLSVFIDKWLQLKNNLNGEAGLQLSINTTDEIIRQKTMPYSLKLEEISEIMSALTYDSVLKGRKITLNFALTEADINAHELKRLFNPEYFICKITPMHLTNSCIENNLITKNGYDHYYPYKNVEENLKSVGFDVLVFIPSHEEDQSRITCGNAILSDN